MPPHQETSNHEIKLCPKFFSIQDLCFQRILSAISNWETADIRVVPNVMYQLRCGSDETDETIDYQINWFIDCAETFIHNHRNSFDTYCLEGKYEEKIWKIINKNDGTITYKFIRSLDNTFSSPNLISGTLQHVASRHHFPGNQMHVDTEHFHSVTPVAGSKERVLTFLIKKKYSKPIDTFVLSSEPEFNPQNDEMRQATEDERREMYEKLIEVLKKCHNAH